LGEGAELGMADGEELGDSVGQLAPQMVVSEVANAPVVGEGIGTPSYAME